MDVAQQAAYLGTEDSVSARASLLALILTSVALNAAAQVLIRFAARSGIATENLTLVAGAVRLVLRPGIFAGLVCYGFSVVLWIYVLSRAEASFAYPFLGVGFVLVALASHFFLGEVLTPKRIIATALIIVGVGVLASS